MIGLVRDLRVINVLAKFENDPWKSMDERVLTGPVCPAACPLARPLGVRQYPGALKGCGVKRCNRRSDVRTARRADRSDVIAAWSYHLNIIWYIQYMYTKTTDYYWYIISVYFIIYIQSKMNAPISDLISNSLKKYDVKCYNLYCPPHNIFAN